MNMPFGGFGLSPAVMRNMGGLPGMQGLGMPRQMPQPSPSAAARFLPRGAQPSQQPGGVGGDLLQMLAGTQLPIGDRGQSALSLLMNEPHQLQNLAHWNLIPPGLMNAQGFSGLLGGGGGL